MQYTQVAAVVNHLVPEIARTGDPAGVLLKYARENNLAPAVLERMGTTYNIGTSLQGMHNSEDRGASVPLLDVGVMLSKYASVGDQVEEPVIRDTPGYKRASLPDLAGRLLGELASPVEDAAPMSKRASFAPVDVKGCEDLVDDARAELRKRADNLHREFTARCCFTMEHGSAPVLDMTGAESDAIRYHGDMAKQAFDWLASYESDRLFNLRILRASEHTVGMHKLAADWSGLAEPARRFTETYELAVACAGLAKKAAEEEEKANIRLGEHDPDAGGVKTLDHDYISVNEGVPVQFYGGTPRGNARSKHHKALHVNTRAMGGAAGGQVQPGVAGNAAGGQVQPGVAGAPAAAQAQPGAAGALPAALRPPPPNNGRFLSYNPAPAPPDAPFEGPDMREPVKKILGMMGVPVDRMLRYTDKELGKPHRNKTQEKVDEGVEAVGQHHILQKLLLTDPVISKADPEEVAALYSTIRRGSSDVANDENLLKFQLREALQYGGTPPDGYKQLLQVSELRDKHTKAQREENKKIYVGDDDSSKSKTDKPKND